MPIHEQAVLASLHLAMPQRSKKDKKLSEEHDAAHGAASGTSSVALHFLPPGALDAVTHRHSQARSFHYANTLPWTDNGARLLPMTKYLDYMIGIGAILSQIETEAKKFIALYPQYVQDAPARMKGLYNPALFPPASIIAARFAADVAIKPVENKEDFRIKATAMELKEMKDSLERQLERGVKRAKQDLIERLIEPLRVLRDALSEEKPVQQKSLAKLRDVVDFIRAANVVESDELEALAATCDKLAKNTAPGRRKDTLQAKYEAKEYEKALAIASNLF